MAEPSLSFGVDYAWGRPKMRTLKNAGARFVCRYVSTPGNTKNIDRAEADQLRAADIAIVIVFETLAARALKGRAAGGFDAENALAQVKAAGGPGDSVIYFAVDFDATPQQQAAINAYLGGASSLLGKDHVGIYGGYWVVKRALDGGVCGWAWQTRAWSGGHWDPRAQLRQFPDGHPMTLHLDGVSCDTDLAMVANFGQWYPPPPPPPPPPDMTEDEVIAAIKSEAKQTSIPAEEFLRKVASDADYDRRSTHWYELMLLAERLKGF
jgi:Rv2525c-like, glycoside hydrolase-like domain